MSGWEIVGEVIGIIVLLGGAVGLIATSFLACVFMSVTKSPARAVERMGRR